MYKWHVHSTLGRGRPVAADISRVTDGIAASLRQFSLSASRCAEDEKPRFTISRTASTAGGNSKSNSNGATARVPRSQRSANAIGEISSLASARVPPRGIDARSLAAKPLKIVRVDSSTRIAPGNSGRGGLGRGGAGARGRGGAGMRGRGGARGRGKKRRGGKGADMDFEGEKEEDEDESAQPLTAEEQRAFDGGLGRRPYIPQTTLASLLNHVPAVATSTAPTNVTRNLANSLQVMTGDRFEHAITPEQKTQKINYGNGTMLWSEEERKAYTRVLPQASDAVKEAITAAVVSGKYVAPEEPVMGDFLGNVDSYARRNETYLSGDTDKLKAKLKELLPVAKTRPAAATPAPPQMAAQVKAAAV